eukprot:SAG31_NODE_793_length_12044_cov_12.886229_12_plen_144_part_00
MFAWGSQRCDRSKRDWDPDRFGLHPERHLLRPYRVTLSRLVPDFSVRTWEIQREKSHGNRESDSPYMVRTAARTEPMRSGVNALRKMINCAADRKPPGCTRFSTENLSGRERAGKSSFARLQVTQKSVGAKFLLSFAKFSSYF